MSNLKTKIDSDSVLKFLQENVDSNISKVTFITGGEMSQAFSYTSKEKKFVIRFNSFDNSFRKDEYAYKNFSSRQIPIPKIYKVDKFNEQLYYCISEKIEGKNLDEFTEEERREFYSESTAILDAIHKVDIGVGKYGWWEGEGEAKFDTWKDYILHNRAGRKEEWDKLYDSFVEKEFIETLHKEMGKLSDFLPEHRYLVHGDYGGNNLMSDGKKITGVIDWGNSMYGDFLYDAAWMEFWSGNYEIYETFRKHYEEIGMETKNYRERFKCYLIHMGIGIIRFWGIAGLEDRYKLTRERLLKFLEM